MRYLWRGGGGGSIRLRLQVSCWLLNANLTVGGHRERECLREEEVLVVVEVEGIVLSLLVEDVTPVAQYWLSDTEQVEEGGEDVYVLHDIVADLSL